MPCEICGKNLPTKRVIIEGAELLVCQACARFGRESPIQSTKIREIMARPKRSTDIYERITDELVPDYGRVIREARIRKHLEIKDVGRMINEKNSVLLKVEEGSMRPSDQLIKKLEKLLEIKLTMEAPPAPKITSGSSSATLGDVAKIRKE